MARKALFLMALFLLLTMSAYTAHARFSAPFYVYTDKKADANHYAPSGWMGDRDDILYNDGWGKGAYSGQTCIKISYIPSYVSEEKWAGMYWQDPPNNWGSKRGGFDLNGARKLMFWIRGERGGEVINDIYIGGLKGKYADTCSAAIGPVKLTKEWARYEINLEGKDLSRIVGGFGWSTNISSNPRGCTFYLDEIKYE